MGQALATAPATAFAHLGVSFTQDFSLEWPAGTLPDAPMMLFSFRFRGNGGSNAGPVAALIADNRGTFGKVLFGSDTLDANHDAEHPKGAMPVVIDNSSGNNGGGVYRAAVADGAIVNSDVTTGDEGFLTAYAPPGPGPSIKNMEYVEFTVAVKVDLPTGAKLGALAVDGTQVAVFSEPSGSTLGGSTIANSVGKFMINVWKNTGGAGSIGPADIDVARAYATRLTSVAGILDPNPVIGFASGFLAKLFTPGLGAVDIGATGVITGVLTPNSGNRPDIVHEVRPGGVASDFLTNRGALGDPVASAGSGCSNTALTKPYLASLHPGETGGQPFMAWQMASALDSLGDTGSYGGLTNDGQEIRVGDLICPWFCSGGTGPRANLACASTNGAYAVLAGTTTGDDFTIWGRTATSADVTANGAVWSGSTRPTLTWTAGGGFTANGSDAKAGVLVIRKPNGSAVSVTAAAPVKMTPSPGSPWLTASITPPAAPALLLDLIKAYGWQYEGDLTPAAGMTPRWKRGGGAAQAGGSYSGCWPYVYEKRLATTSAVSPRSYVTTTAGNPGVVISLAFS